MLIINADDWGASSFITGRIKEFIDKGIANSTSAMVFMKDSNNAAELAKEMRIDTGLHFNVTEPLTQENISPLLKEKHQQLIRYLRKSKLSQVIYNPFLHKEFEYVFKAQYEEYERLYGKAPSRIDGHQHMHLCTNMLIGNFIPRKTRVRRTYTFAFGEKDIINRSYRIVVDQIITKRYECTRFFYSLGEVMYKNGIKQLETLKSILGLAHTDSIEIHIHPHMQTDYEYCQSDQFIELDRQKIKD
jgi:predicted glycoside hydrolase/deacetylase ChbG (UPF0249 family)